MLPRVAHVHGSLTAAAAEGQLTKMLFRAQLSRTRSRNLMRKRSQYESYGWHFALATVYIVHCFALLQMHPQPILGAGSVICTVHSSKHRALTANNRSRSGKRRGREE